MFDTNNMPELYKQIRLKNADFNHNGVHYQKKDLLVSFSGFPLDMNIADFLGDQYSEVSGFLPSPLYCGKIQDCTIISPRVLENIVRAKKIDPRFEFVKVEAFL